MLLPAMVDLYCIRLPMLQTCYYYCRRRNTLCFLTMHLYIGDYSLYWCLLLLIDSYVIVFFLNKYSQLSRCCTARGSIAGFSMIDPTKVKTHESFLFTEKLPCIKKVHLLDIVNRLFFDHFASALCRSKVSEPNFHQVLPLLENNLQVSILW